MRNLVILALVVAALFYANRMWSGTAGEARPHGTGEQRSGGPVRQLEQRPTDLMEMGNAMPQAGGGSTRAMLDTARGAGK